ncbi:MAG: lipopolysaccharide heptosyltransferase II [Candidatus Omnitrophica bacterium]|nr:lipopolysaccharide heptosyltransferase II [Candidatus Omnitrophota bacterium]
MEKQKRILIFELNWLGDILFSFPFLRAIREACPDAYIACAIVPRYVDLLKNNPWINEVHALSDNNKITSLSEKIAFTRMVRREKYNTSFFLKPSGTKTIIASFAGISERIGFAGKNSSLTKEVEKPGDEYHRADVMLALAGAFGIDKADGTYEYFISDIDREHADNILRDVGGGARRMVGMNPGGNWDAKRWPQENFVRLARKLLLRFEDIEIMVTGARKDVNLADKMVESIDFDRCYSVAGKTGLNELAGLFRECNLVISADSGPLHLAAATGVTTIGLFGPTSHKLTGTIGKGKNIIIHNKIDCKVPCYEENCVKDHICMKSITVKQVFSAAEKVLSEKV